MISSALPSIVSQTSFFSSFLFIMSILYKSLRKEILEIHRRTTADDPLRHEPRSDRRQEDTVTVVGRGNPQVLDSRPGAEYRKTAGSPWPEPEPRTSDRQVREGG